MIGTPTAFCVNVLGPVRRTVPCSALNVAKMFAADSSVLC